MKEFYVILKNLYQAKIKKPLPEWHFFKSFYENEEIGKFFLVQLEGKIIGGIMSPIFNGVIYEWYIAGRDREFNNVYPSVLATWAAIKYATDNNLKYFDFMGAGKPDDNYGVREFKSKFGGELVNFGRHSHVHSPTRLQFGKLVYRFYRRLV